MYQNLQFKIVFHFGMLKVFTKNILSSILGTWCKSKHFSKIWQICQIHLEKIQLPTNVYTSLDLFWGVFPWEIAKYTTSCGPQHIVLPNIAFVKADYVSYSDISREIY